MNNLISFYNSEVDSSNVLSGSGDLGFICSGSTILYNNKPYVCINSHYQFEDNWNPENCPSLWMPLSSKSHKPEITNCKNCGAPLHGNVCEYCGTEY